MGDQYQKSYRFGRCLAEQGLHPLSRNQDRIEKLVTGTTMHATTTTKATASTTITNAATKPTTNTTEISTTNGAPKQAPSTRTTKYGSQGLKITKDILTVDTWNV
ncbi:unnamed protein product [Rotaria sp. Silwood1]|nr:unnamed protein product [Rotaria sp. Silwood1]CAF1649489.1 unnamed protein product [Rotaria sp. Silwood1]CAF3777131.1 unnamed protein product [Rotaria sp. Silwood1]CAF3818737.1 unnamed protein product [Rotaria sp. Silwood1]CAF4977231.1 unnamed protein product [Rotaria sp. Silwood1]